VLITEDFVSTAVRTKMNEFEASSQSQVLDINARLNDLEAAITSITSTVDNISSKMADNVLALLTAPDGILTKHAAKMDAQNTTIDRRISTATEALANK
jgi:hypothetical protein